jgi:hypothetical protein
MGGNRSENESENGNGSMKVRLGDDCIKQENI